MTRRLALLAIGILLGGFGTAAAEGLELIEITDSLSDADLRALRNQKRAELQRRARATRPPVPTTIDPPSKTSSS